jgi:thiol:disulfide interchange protein DsbD
MSLYNNQNSQKLIYLKNILLFRHVFSNLTNLTFLDHLHRLHSIQGVFCSLKCRVPLAICLQAVKATLGIFMLAISIVLLSRILPNWITQLLWGALFIGAGAAVFRVYAELHRPWQILKNIVGVLFVFYGIALWSQLFIVVHSGSLPILQLNQKKERKIQVINTPQELNLALIAAGNKPVLLEFSAQWCLACQVMEERVFPKKDVQKALEPFTQLRVDLTQITSEKKILMQRWDVIAPPVMLFIKNERELPDGRLIGEIDAQELIQTANKSSR